MNESKSTWLACTYNKVYIPRPGPDRFLELTVIYCILGTPSDPRSLYLYTTNLTNHRSNRIILRHLVERSEYERVCHIQQMFIQSNDKIKNTHSLCLFTFPASAGCYRIIQQGTLDAGIHYYASLLVITPSRRSRGVMWSLRFVRLTSCPSFCERDNSRTPNLHLVVCLHR